MSELFANLHVFGTLSWNFPIETWNLRVHHWTHPTLTVLEILSRFGKEPQKTRISLLPPLNTTPRTKAHESARKVCPISLEKLLSKTIPNLRKTFSKGCQTQRHSSEERLFSTLQLANLQQISWSFSRLRRQFHSARKRTKAHEIQLQKTPKGCQFLRNLLFPLSIPLWEPFPRQKL